MTHGSNNLIHPTAIIDETATIAADVKIGPYVVIGANVEIATGCEIRQHATVEGPTTIGANTRIFPFAAIGLEPQDKKFHGEQSRLEIGSDNYIREYVTINRGSESGGGVTKVGNNNWIMAYVHIAHDCILGSNITMANGTTLGGHVEIGNHATLGGLTAIHQFCRVGEYALTGGQSMISQDVAPFVIAAGNRAKTHGLNYVGLERKEFTSSEIEEINQIYRIFFLSGLSKDNALSKMRDELPPSKNLDLFANFIESSQRGVCR
ncbi:MAG: acyl-ACP--UDP-N-acetylglucosamine O-acyltransferase [SAR324 cluster bacterium]|nr:acyl-ACP--UDP-N-acetylglucosamine O-acyltransferase [SAR324 cluster bacterium]